jgi:hypothetical protein
MSDNWMSTIVTPVYSGFVGERRGRTRDQVPSTISYSLVIAGLEKGSGTLLSMTVQEEKLWAHFIVFDKSESMRICRS